ncbi:MAG: outer membrane beta-barrel family protein [Prevotellaceae bacterium]|nr:outer membrane beta-barrel family protein [Prevotellaceae bacterium]
MEVYGAEFSLNFSETNALSLQATWQPNYVPCSDFEQQNDFFSNAGQQPDSASVSKVEWKYHTRFANAGLKYDFKINRLNMDAQLDWLWQDDLTSTDNKFNFENFSIFDNVAIQTRQFRKSVAYVPSLNGNYGFGTSSLGFGAKYYFVESLLNLDFSENNIFTPESDFIYSATENIFAVYGVFNSSINRLRYEIGLRGEFSSLKGNFNIQNANQTLNEFLPSVSISYSIKDRQNISLSYNKNILRPPFSRISPLYYFTGPFDAYEGNPYLKPAVLNSLQLKYLFGNKSITLIYNNNKNVMGTFPFIRDNITVQKFFNYNQTIVGAVLGFPVKHTNWLNGQYTLRLYGQTVENADADAIFKAKILTSSVNIAENIKFPNSYTVNILFNYSLPQYVGADKIRTYPGINFSFAKSFNDNFSISLYLRDFFKINNKSITSRDLDDISFYSTNYWDSRSINISLTYKFYKGRRTNTKTFNSDEIGNRL